MTNNSTPKSELDYDLMLLAKFMNDKSNDRTLAIVCASYVDKYLGELIKVMLIGLNSDLHKKVFDGQGLLGPIASKIDMAKALGLIDTGMHKNAKLIARVRNRFAHNLEIDSFSHPEVTKLVQKMEYPMVSQPDTLVNTIKVIESARAPATRVRFEVITIVFCYGLYLELPRVQSIMAQHRPKN